MSRSKYVPPHKRDYPVVKFFYKRGSYTVSDIWSGMHISKDFYSRVLAYQSELRKSQEGATPDTTKLPFRDLFCDNKYRATTTLGGNERLDLCHYGEHHKNLPIPETIIAKWHDVPVKLSLAAYSSEDPYSYRLDTLVRGAEPLEEKTHATYPEVTLYLPPEPVKAPEAFLIFFFSDDGPDPDPALHFITKFLSRYGLHIQGRLASRGISSVRRDTIHDHDRIGRYKKQELQTELTVLCELNCEQVDLIRAAFMPVSLLKQLVLNRNDYLRPVASIICKFIQDNFGVDEYGCCSYGGKYNVRMLRIAYRPIYIPYWQEAPYTTGNDTPYECYRHRHWLSTRRPPRPAYWSWSPPTTPPGGWNPVSRSEALSPPMTPLDLDSPPATPLDLDSSEEF